MIQFSSTLIQLLENPVIEAFYLVTVGTYRTTSYFTDITYDSQLYLSDGKLLSADPPRLSAVVDRELYKIVLADPEYALGSLTTNIVGDNFEVRLIFNDPTTGNPYLNPADTILLYKGTVDSNAYAIDTNNAGEVAISISGSSPMADLDLSRPFYTGKEFIRNISNNDTSFDQVYDGSGNVNLRWGKG